jgi:SPFH domain / Band 7 family
MTQDQFMGIFSLVVVISVLVASVNRQRTRGKKRILITDYRRGVHFVSGSFKSVLGPGSYRFDPRNEQINIVDMRPQPILIERLPFQDALTHNGIISVGTELLVRDPRLAATALRDQVKDAYVMVRETLRAELSRQIAVGKEKAANLSQSITNAVNTELAKVGMAVSDVEITELWSHSPQPQTTVGSAIIQ